MKKKRYFSRGVMFLLCLVFALMFLFGFGPEIIVGGATGGTVIYDLMPILVCVFLLAGLLLGLDRLRLRRRTETRSTHLRRQRRVHRLRLCKNRPVVDLDRRRGSNLHRDTRDHTFCEEKEK